MTPAVENLLKACLLGEGLAAFISKYKLIGPVYKPDILLLDLHMPLNNGLETLGKLLHRLPGLRVILLTGAIGPSQTLEALRMGARGVVEKHSLAEGLIRAIRAVGAGDYWLGGEQVSNLVEVHKALVRQAVVREPKTYGLTRRELTTVRCISEGYTNRDIAKELVISEETVKRHLSNIFDKTGVSTRLELALFAVAKHLVEIPVTA